tara:strand:+ start:1143 stop:1466 length:324 start_codon:yes stop_codon:yes gene_type:complete
MASCRSSGVKTSSTAINAGQCKLVSIHAVLTGSKPTTIKVFDNASAASGLELARMILARPDPADPATTGANPPLFEFDMHGVLAVNGLYLSISSGTGEGAAVSVEFA